MTATQQYQYDRIAEAIAYIKEHFKEQPDLDEVAAQVHLSPFHFQKLFTDWAGVSPKKFLQYISIEHAKRVLKEGRTSIFDAALETGLSGTGRLHDLFVNIEGMTPGEFKNGGAALQIHYSFSETPFGNIIVASTRKGICYMAFAGEEAETIATMKTHFPNAHYQQMTDMVQQKALYIFTQDWSRIEKIKLHLKGSAFQLKVWESLLKVPMGGLSTYGDIANEIQQPNAARAVGTAIGSNPVAFLIPCHRLIRAGGDFGGYMWGSNRKSAIIGWEAAKTANGNNG